MSSQLLWLTRQLEDCPDFHQPKGFDLRVQLAVTTPLPFEHPLQRALLGNAWLAIHEFFKNDAGQVETSAETGAGIQVWVNQLSRLFPDDSQGECDALELPRFYYKTSFSVVDGANGYVLLKDGTRVITNGRPLYIPYTREQYLRYYTRRQEKIIGEQKEALQHLREMKERAAAASMQEVVRSAEKGIADAQTRLAGLETRLAKWNTQLKELTPAEKQQQAFLYFNTDPDVAKDANGQALDAGRVFEPVTADEPHGLALFTQNPAYFSPSLPVTDIQLISIGKDVDTRFVREEFIQMLDRVMECVDYKNLKTLIKS
jgi:hypothetical protein